MKRQRGDFIRPLFFRPGQQVKIFEIYRRTAQTDSKGRINYKADKEKVGELKGTVSFASQKQVNQWKQIEHPVSHTIIVQGKSEAQAEDILIYENERYCIQWKDNPAELGFFEIFYCEKRIGSG